jgi:outer membrane protein
MKSHRLFIAFLATALANTAFAEVKLAYVDMQRALVEVEEGRSAKAKLQSEVERRKKEFDAEQAKLRDDKAVLDKQGAMMSEEVRNQKFTELQKRLFELTQKAEKMQVELADKERTELKKIFEKMDPIIAAIAQREGFTMVLERSDSGLVYAPANLDVTNELVRSYNDKFPVKNAPPKTTASTPAAPKAAAPAADKKP